MREYAYDRRGDQHTEHKKTVVFKLTWLGVKKERFLARIENILKRYEGRQNLLEKDNFLLDRNTYTLYINGHSILLPKNQGKLLETLLVATDSVVTKEELSMKLWNTTEFIDENALQVNIARLKKVMKQAGIALQVKSVRGIGYKLEEERQYETES